jgi:hypothetical protein
MADQKPEALRPFETEQQRTERIRNEERKAHAARTTEQLTRRFGSE